MPLLRRLTPRKRSGLMSMNSSKIRVYAKMATKCFVLAVTLCWWLWGSSMYFPEWNCHCDDLKGYSLMPLMIFAPMVLIRCFVWRRTLGWIVMITAVWSSIVQWGWLCDSILLLTGDKAGYLRDHGEVCHLLLEWNLAWLFGMIVTGVLFVKSRQIGRSLKAPIRFVKFKTQKRGKPCQK